MIRDLRCIGGFTTFDDATITNDGRALRDCAVGEDVWIGVTIVRVTPVGFDPARDDPRMCSPEPGEPRDGVHGEGGGER